MVKFLYNIFLVLVIASKDAIRDTVAGTAIFLITGKSKITREEYKKLKMKVLEVDDFDYLSLGMKLGKFFYRNPICKPEDIIVEWDDVTSTLVYECFQNAIECNLSEHIKNLCVNKSKINNILYSL